MAQLPMKAILAANVDHAGAFHALLQQRRQAHLDHVRVTESPSAARAAQGLADSIGRALDILTKPDAGEWYRTIGAELSLWVPVSECAERALRDAGAMIHQ